jgi:hypothetical protein
MPFVHRADDSRSTAPRRRRCAIRGATLLLTLVAAAGAQASTTSAAIESIRLNSAGNLVLVYPAGGVQGAPSCHTSKGSFYSFSMTRPMAKEFFAALLAAHARGTPVTLYGSGGCSDDPTSETLDSLSVN